MLEMTADFEVVQFRIQCAGEQGGFNGRPRQGALNDFIVDSVEKSGNGYEKGGFEGADVVNEESHVAAKEAGRAADEEHVAENGAFKDVGEGEVGDVDVGGVEGKEEASCPNRGNDVVVRNHCALWIPSCSYKDTKLASLKVALSG